MTFSTLTFICFFMPALLLIYFVLPAKWMAARNGVLLAVSVFFYAWGEPMYVFLILLCVCCTYLLSFAVEKHNKAAFVICIAVNLLPLLFFKYADFILININSLFNINIPLVKLALPVGISFYTFQVLTYVIDLFRGTVSRQKNPAYLALYVFFFPQLVAGPVVRYSDIEAQLTKRKSTFSGIAYGTRRFIFGLAKKMLANQAGFIVTTITEYSQNEIGTNLLWLSVIAYGVQIYFDFSGYSDMAIGLGKIFGFDFQENFNKPYTSRSITDFWHRWHISLSSFFRDYVYIPLGGNCKTVLKDGTEKVNIAKHIRNLFIVWLLTGLWHGASWNFIIWGLYYFVLLTLEKYVYGKWLEKMHVIPARIISYFLYTFGWAIFMFETNSISELFSNLGRLFSGDASSVGVRALAIQGNLIVLVFALILSMAKKPEFINTFEKKHPVAGKTLINTYAVLLFAFSIFLIVGESFNPFIYFRF